MATEAFALAGDNDDDVAAQNNLREINRLSDIYLKLNPQLTTRPRFRTHVPFPLLPLLSSSFSLPLSFPVFLSDIERCNA